MRLRDKDKLAVGKLMLYGSVLTVVLAGADAVGSDVYLAATQWLLVGVLLSVWAVFVLIEASFKLK